MPSTTYNKGLDSTLTGLNIRAPSKLIIKIFLFPLLDDSTTLTTTLITTFRRVNVTWPEPIRFKPITPKHQPATPWVKSGTDEVHSDSVTTDSTTLLLVGTITPLETLPRTA